MNNYYTIVHYSPDLSRIIKFVSNNLQKINDKVEELRKVGHLILDTYIQIPNSDSREEWYPQDLTVFDCAPNFGKYNVDLE